MTSSLQASNLSNFSTTIQHSATTATPLCSCPQCMGSQTDSDTDSTPDFSDPNSTVSSTGNTGDYRIDALLGGTAWDTNTVTYSFYSDALGGSYYGWETGVSEVSNAIKADARYIIENYIEPYIDIDFVEVDDTATTYGQMRYMFSDNPSYAYARLPAELSGGDVHLNSYYGNNSSTNGFESGQGSHGFVALIHETLHALGLKHPGNYNGGGSGWGPFLPGYEDNNTNTVMSYNFVGSSPATMMPYDILALQQLYGEGDLNAGTTTYTFDTVHSFSDGTQKWGSAGEPMKLAIWDASGTDTLDFSQLEAKASGYRFDIAQGGMLTRQSAYNSVTYSPLNSDTESAQTTNYGTAIAYNTRIENVVATSSADEVLGNGANNHFWGRSGDDQLFGKGGDDILDGGAGSDILDGGEGSDTASYASASQEVVIDLAIATYAGAAENDTLVSIENVTGSEFDDFIRGDDTNNVLNGLGGNDTINGLDGDDTLSGGAGKDKLRGGKGSDTLFGGNGRDRLLGMSGRDNLTGGNGKDRIRAGRGRDELFGENGNDVLKGGAGRDRLDGGTGRDVLVGGQGRDEFVLTLGKGAAIIRDFSAVYDKLGFGEGLGIQDLSYSERGNSTQINSGDDVLAVVANTTIFDILSSFV